MSNAHSEYKRIVITGGPGAGKTAILEMIKKINPFNTTVLPEAASILFKGGFWRLPSKTAQAAAQRAIFQIQKEMENLAIDEKKWKFILCDRGTLDGLAYWPYNEKMYWKMNHTNLDFELKRYHAVIHLRTPLVNQGYNQENPLRIENALTAKMIDNKIALIWKDHPNYNEIDSNDDFMTKSKLAINLVNQFIT